MKFQKSPFPYVALFLFLIITPIILSLTVEKKIKEPIHHIIKKNNNER